MLRAWQAQTQETALFPEEEIVDAHIHLWDANTERERPLKDLASVRSKLGNALTHAALRSGMPGREPLGFARMHIGHRRGLDSFLSAYLAPDHLENVRTSGHNVVASIYLECGWAGGAAAEVAHQAAAFQRHGLPSAVVGEIIIQEGAEKAAATVDACVAAIETVSSSSSAAPLPERLLVGFRTMLQSPEPSRYFNGGDPRPCDSPAAIAACQLLGERGLVLDVGAFHTQLPQMRRLAAACPDTTIVLNHLGFPVNIGQELARLDSPAVRSGGVFECWRADMKLLATECPNVMVKLSGIGMPIFGFGFPHANGKPPDSATLASACAPLVSFVIEAFGVDRCMCASNFPPDGVSCSYGCLWNALKRLVEGYGPDARRKLLRDNALATYRLRLPPAAAKEERGAQESQPELI